VTPSIGLWAGGASVLAVGCRGLIRSARLRM